jgi:hypothetical protein
LKYLLSLKVDEVLTQFILVCLQLWINFFSTFQIIKPRDQFLRLLGAQCYSKTESEVLSNHNIQAIKILFNIVHCLGSTKIYEKNKFNKIKKLIYNFIKINFL